MGLSVERVRVADILPLEDQYGNKFVSRDYDLPANKDYVEDLAASFGENGEPDEPVKLIRDGDRFRIKAGNSRVRAMELLGTAECWAVIDDEDTVQSVVETVVRTNTKKKYEPVEESRFVQQLAMFGDDEYVGGVASISPEKAGRMRRARELAGDKAEALTLERMYALAEFDGDDDAVAEILESDEGSWRNVASRLHREKEKRELEEAFRARASKLRLKIVDERPDYNSKLRYICRCEDPDDLEGDYMAASVDNIGIVAHLESSWYGIELNFYGERMGESEEERARAERRKMAEEYKAGAKKVDEAARAWFDGQMSDAPAGALPAAFDALATACYGIASDHWTVRDVMGEFGFTDVADIEEGCVFLFLLGYSQGKRGLATYVDCLAEEQPYKARVSSLEKSLAWVDLHLADGWEPDDEMGGFLDSVREKVGELMADDEDEE